MKTDITNRKDIVKLVNAFYEKVKTDEVIGYYFKEVIPMDWEKHLPIMYDFWENVLFYTGGYNGNPMMKHMAIHEKSHFSKSHFEQWTFLFNQTVDEFFEGENTEVIKQKALNIATIMQIKIFRT